MVVKEVTSNMKRSFFHRRCCVEGCTSEKGKGGQLIFFRFPKNKERRKLWLEACGVSDDHALHICELHFNLHYPGQRKLSQEMIPTLRLPNIRRTQLPNLKRTHLPDKSHITVVAVDSLLKSQEADEYKMIKPQIIKTYSKKDPVLFLKPEEITKKARVEQFKQILSKTSNQSSNDSSKTQNTENQSVSTSRAKKTTEALLTKNTSSKNLHHNALNEEMWCISKTGTGKTEDIEMYVENNNGGVSCKCKKFNENITYYLKRIDELEDENELLVRENLRLKKELQKHNINI